MIIPQRVLFIGGSCDPAVLFGSLEAMRAALPNLDRSIVLERVGDLRALPSALLAAASP
jgi:hypothetical protein